MKQKTHTILFEDVLKARLNIAAKSVMKDVNHHFKNYNWNLDFSFLVADVFYQAFGYHMESHILTPILKKYVIGGDPRHGCVVKRKPFAKIPKVRKKRGRKTKARKVSR